MPVSYNALSIFLKKIFHSLVHFIVIYGSSWNIIKIHWSQMFCSRLWALELEERSTTQSIASLPDAAAANFTIRLCLMGTMLYLMGLKSINHLCNMRWYKSGTTRTRSHLYWVITFSFIIILKWSSKRYSMCTKLTWCINPPGAERGFMSALYFLPIWRSIWRGIWGINKLFSCLFLLLLRIFTYYGRDCRFNNSKTRLQY